MFDKNNRHINYLRISITDHCNLRCQYCLPENNNSFSNNTDLLTADDIEKIVRATSLIGIEKVRITGGEPLIRKDFLEILKKINSIEKIKKIAITTNGFNLSNNLNEFSTNGLNRINISLDSLKPSKYSEITRGGDFFQVMKTIEQASLGQFERIRINVVIMKGINDNEILDFVNLTKELDIGVRFIELMPIGEGKQFISMKNSEILDIIKAKYTLEKDSVDKTDGPASYYKILNFKGEIGFISPLSNRFCEHCNRIRVTSSGFLKLCLHYNQGVDLIPYLKSNISTEELAKIIKSAIYNKPKEHQMNCNSQDKTIETKRMNEIGG
ncbi:GTP 3',8-cyclase MoaA [uncultured Cetobacterium sp.]|uniref:GTP 3',8-cyclase MoaA n=1 Tax=uncultured Cetobacterium sp. TaxID=527638 RepID=UPI002630DFE9|nr:GTP 3',8-cyclase MoaA [uncultured Cetobacterium sp.]